jgi:hypothetical protein
MKSDMGSARRRTIHEYFTDAYRREVRHDQPVAITPAYAPDGLQAAFSLSLNHSGHIDSVRYHCSTCMTLLALCEHLSVVVAGLELSQARALTPGVVLEWHPEIPAERKDRVELAIAALRLGLSDVDNGGHL